MFSVVITEKGGAQRRLDFDKNEVTIGRVQGNDIILPKGNVSKRHSRIVLKDNRFIVVDLKSTNGTYVNGRKITSPLVVKSGDKIYIGDFILTLEEAAGAGAHEAPQPVMAAPPPAQPPAMQPPAMQPPPVMQQPPPVMQQPPPVMQQPAQPPAMHAPPMQAPQQPPMPQAPQVQMAPPPQAVSPAPAVSVGADRRPPPLRSAPPPPRQPTLAAGGIGAPPPLPGRPEPAPAPAPRMPSEPPPPAARADGAPAERYPLDEEPADETMAPSPRVVAAARPAAARPEPARAEPAPAAPARADYVTKDPGAREPMQTDAPPRPAAPVAPAIQEARPVTAPLAAPAPRRAAIPRARDPRDPLGHVLASLSETFDIGSLVPPEAVPADRWRDARAAVDSAIARLEREGGAPGDREALAVAAVQEAVGLGPLGALLEDAGVLEIVVEGPSAILVDRGAGLAAVPGRFSSADQLVTIAGRLVTRGGGAFDPAVAMHEATLPDGAHVVAVLPPVALRGPVIEIRRTGRAPVTGESLVQQGMLSAEMLATLRAAVQARRNVVVVGAGELGVSTAVSMIANLADPEDRVLAIESAPELALAAAHVVRLAASASVSLQQLVASAPRLRADRVVVDGASGPETRDALLLLASRGAGAVLGVHSAPAASALDHLEALAGLAGAGDTIGRLLTSAVHVVVRVGRDANGVRRILSIAEVTSDEGIPSAQELWIHTGEFQATGAQATFAAA